MDVMQDFTPNLSFRWIHQNSSDQALFFSLDELKAAFNSLDNHKTLGFDGLPVEFYRAFWDLLRPVLFNVLMYGGVQEGILPLR